MKWHYQVLCLDNVFYPIKLDDNRSVSLKNQFDSEERAQTLQPDSPKYKSKCNDS